MDEGALVTTGDIAHQSANGQGKAPQSIERAPEEERKITSRIVPVIVGGTFLAYSYVREFNRAYGTKRAIVVLSEPIKMLTESRFTDCRIVAGSHDPEVLLETLKSIASELAEKTPEAIPLLLGCDDRHALFFAKNKEALQTAGYVCMCNDYEMIERVSDKHNFYDLCEELGVPYAKSWYFSASPNGPDELPVHDFPYPLILKPSDTTAFQNAEIKGKRKAYEIETPEELAQVWVNIKASDYNEEMVVQDFIPGGDEALSIITTFSDPTGEVKLVSGGEVCLQDHNPAALGNPLCVIGARQEQVIEDAKRIIKHLGYVGYGNFDLKYDSRRDQYCFFEINIRAGRSTYYTSLGGVNFVTPIVDQYILGKELAYREAYDPFVYCCVPDRVLKKSIADKRQLEEALALKKATNPNPYPLDYKADSLGHNLWSYVMYYNQIRKFKRFFWDTDGQQFKEDQA